VRIYYLMYNPDDDRLIWNSLKSNDNDEAITNI
jgi:hypothetical protein